MASPPFTTADAITDRDGQVEFHYLIAETFCALSEAQYLSKPAAMPVKLRWWSSGRRRADDVPATARASCGGPARLRAGPP